MDRPIKSVIAYLQHKRCKTGCQEEESPKKDTKISALKEVIQKKERAPLMNRFEQSFTDLFGKITVLEDYITALQTQIK